MSISTTSATPMPPGLAVAPRMPDLMLPVKIRRGFFGFLRNHPTVAIGGTLLLLLVLVGIFAPYLGTVDPTALAPARRTRAPSAAYWFGSDLLGRDIYSRVLYGTRVSLAVGLSVAVLASLGVQAGQGHLWSAAMTPIDFGRRWSAVSGSRRRGW